MFWGHISYLISHISYRRPHGMFWGRPPANAPANMYTHGKRWDRVASELASVVHQQCARWLLFVEGVDHCKGPSKVFGCGENEWANGKPPLSKDDPRCECRFYSAEGQDSSGPPASCTPCTRTGT